MFGLQDTKVTRMVLLPIALVSLIYLGHSCDRANKSSYNPSAETIKDQQEYERQWQDNQDRKAAIEKAELEARNREAFTQMVKDVHYYGNR
jgi:hypothetical protein